MARPPLAPGTHGKVRVRPAHTDDAGNIISWCARATYRGLDGEIRALGRSGPTRSGAIERLDEALHAAESAPETPPLDLAFLEESHTVYRFYDSEGALLYVGMSMNSWRRISNHRSDQPWWLEVARIDLDHWPDWQGARDAEKRALLTEAPRYNTRAR